VTGPLISPCGVVASLSFRSAGVVFSGGACSDEMRRTMLGAANKIDVIGDRSFEEAGPSFS
jgi:hypothetical protein